jgi:hypothetical protein
MLWLARLTARTANSSLFPEGWSLRIAVKPFLSRFNPALGQTKPVLRHI